MILNAPKQQKIAKQSLSFFITTQQPASIIAARKQVERKKNPDSLRNQNISAKIKKNNIILPNVSSYKDIPCLSNTEALMVTPKETETLDSVTTKSSKPAKKGVRFLDNRCASQYCSRSQELVHDYIDVH